MCPVLEYCAKHECDPFSCFMYCLTQCDEGRHFYPVATAAGWEMLWYHYGAGELPGYVLDFLQDDLQKRLEDTDEDPQLKLGFYG